MTIEEGTAQALHNRTLVDTSELPPTCTALHSVTEWHVNDQNLCSNPCCSPHQLLATQPHPKNAISRITVMHTFNTNVDANELVTLQQDSNVKMCAGHNTNSPFAKTGASRHNKECRPTDATGHHPMQRERMACIEGWGVV